MKRQLAALVMLALAAAGPARAQYQRSGFIAVGRATVDGSIYDPDFTIAAGYLARFGPAVGAYIGVRTPIAWSRFVPNEQALRDSAGVGAGEVSGRTATVYETGLELVAGYDTGALGGYGWYGIHYLSETRNQGSVGFVDLPRESRTDLGPAYGAGLRFQLSPRMGVFTEWFRSGGFDDQMLRMEGLRAGVSAVF